MPAASNPTVTASLPSGLVVSPCEGSAWTVPAKVRKANAAKVTTHG